MKYHQLKLSWWESYLLVLIDFVIGRHVLLLITISAVLFVLLNRFLAETGFVPIERQM